MAPFLYGAVFQKVMGKFLHEEGVASSSVKDELPEFRHHLSTFENVLHQLSAAFGGKLIHTDLAVIGFAPPQMCIFRPIKKNQQDVGVGQPIDQIAQEFLRSVVNPVQVLYSKNEGLAFTLANEQVSDSLKDFYLFRLGLKLQVRAIVHLDG